MSIRKILLGLFIVSATTIVSCSGLDTARKHSNILALQINSVSKNAVEFRQAREKLNRARLKNMSNLEMAALSIEQDQAMDQAIWSISKQDPRFILYSKIINVVDQRGTQLSEFEDMKRKREKEISETKSLIEINNDKLAATSKSLSKLAEKPNVSEQLLFYYEFISKSIKDIDESNKDAVENLENATKLVKDKYNSNTNGKK